MPNRPEAPSLLTLDNIAAGYGAKTVIANLSLRLAPGQVLALLGHNGAGKTTTLKTIMGVLTCRGGRMLVGDRRIDRMRVAERVALGLRLLPEGRGVFADLSVGENVDVVAARNCAGAKVLFGVADVYRLFPALTERRTARAGSLSGGQQQMLALGLAVLGTPRCLLLDEPSIGLAPNLVERLFDQIGTLCRAHGLSAVLVEQNVAAALRIADHVVIMNSGVVVFEGTPDDARRSKVWDYF